MRIFMADLGHNQLTLSSDVYPLGIGNLVTYALAHAQVREPLEFKIFREPLDLKAALDSEPPDVLGFSSYSWNHNLSCH
ncbi:MAG: radical SAM protein, partial [Chloroflexi bacterium]|nr:radical SAM protein [Chloroflexota bacterium]